MWRWRGERTIVYILVERPSLERRCWFLIEFSEFSLSFSFLFFTGTVSSTVFSLWELTSLCLARPLHTCHYSLLSYAWVQTDKLPTWLLIEEGRGSLKGTLLTKGKGTLIVANSTDRLSSVISEESTYKGYSQREKREKEGNQRESMTREVSPIGITIEDKEKAVLS